MKLKYFAMALLVLACAGLSIESYAAVPAPANLVAVVGGGNITISWTPITGVSKYAIRIHKDGTPYDPCSAMVACTEITAATYTFAAEAGAKYDYWVHAVEPTTNVLGPSSGSVVTAASGPMATITWAPNTEADLAGYRLYRAVPCGGTMTQLQEYGKTTTGTSPIPAGAAEIEYAMTAFDTTGNESPLSAKVCKQLVTKDTTPPLAPTDIQVTIK